MIGHVQQSVRRKISDFIHLEDGRVGNQKAITVAAIVTSSVFAGLLLTPKPVLAWDCEGCNTPCPAGWYCCWTPDCGQCPQSCYRYTCDLDGGECGPL